MLLSLYLGLLWPFRALHSPMISLHISFTLVQFLCLNDFTISVYISLLNYVVAIYVKPKYDLYIELTSFLIYLSSLLVPYHQRKMIFSCLSIPRRWMVLANSADFKHMDENIESLRCFCEGFNFSEKL